MGHVGRNSASARARSTARGRARTRGGTRSGRGTARRSGSNSARVRAQQAKAKRLAASRRASTRAATQKRLSSRRAPSKSRVSFVTRTVPKVRRTSSSFRSRRRGAGRTIGGLSPRTIRAQQELSNRFGVTSFNRRGGISTVPTLESGGFSDINVGIGRFSDINDFARQVINRQVGFEINRRKREGTGITIDESGRFVPTAQADSPVIISDPTQPARFFSGFDSNRQPQFQDSPGGSGFNIDQLFDNLPLLAAGFVGLLVIMRLVKKI